MDSSHAAPGPNAQTRTGRLLGPGEANYKVPLKSHVHVFVAFLTGCCTCHITHMNDFEM